MTITLTDRYVDAAMRTVPEKQRADLADELRASIADQIDARVDAGEPADDAERAVLTDLGDPDKLAAGYTGRLLWLIGPRYYLLWWRLLKLLLAIVLPLAAFGVALGQSLTGHELGAIIGSTIGITIEVGVHLFFWLTVVFAIIERVAHADAQNSGRAERGSLVPWTVDYLPDARYTGASFADLVASLILIVVTVAAVLWDHFIGFVVFASRAGEEPLSILDRGLWPWWIGGLFVIFGLRAILQVVVFLRGRWTAALAACSAVLGLIIAVATLWLLAQGHLINPEFWITLIPNDGETVAQIMAIVIGLGIAGVAVWDPIDAWFKARRTPHQPR